MADVAERLSYVEGRIQEQAMRIDDVRDAVARLEQRMHSFEERVDRRFEAVDRRFEAVDRRFENIELRLDGIDSKLSRQFTWLVGMYATGLIAVVAALISR